MLRSYINTSDLTSREPELGSLYFTGESDYSSIIADAKEQLELEARNMGLELKKLCTPLSLSTSESNADTVERARWVVDMTNLGGETYTFTLSGRNASTDNWTEIKSLSVTATGETTTTISKTFYYYKIAYSTVSESENPDALDFESFLVERTFEYPHIWLSLSLAYKRLARPNNDYDVKADYYEQKYNKALSSMKMSYDDDADGEIDSDEYGINTSSARVWR